MTESRFAAKNACGTCRSRTADGKPVEHEECAARAQIVEAPDAPGYEDLAEMTLEHKAALPARFHVPVFEALGSPQMWLCAVCWDEGTTSRWPCATASEKGAEVFTR
ncbi:hypothetical protein [Spirillospora sp. NBC_01491]|uniref:hypothetical protein n=1 Tax=Spirillospora sp. NBC_01491 TaxID=2976007 RepID=UPI002E2F0BB5|nr:hypothetical protein [Spirillospora sp. NBC_01491]